MAKTNIVVNPYTNDTNLGDNFLINKRYQLTSGQLCPLGHVGAMFVACVVLPTVTCTNEGRRVYQKVVLV